MTDKLVLPLDYMQAPLPSEAFEAINDICNPIDFGQINQIVALHTTFIGGDLFRDYPRYSYLVKSIDGYTSLPYSALPKDTRQRIAFSAMELSNTPFSLYDFKMQIHPAVARMIPGSPNLNQYEALFFPHAIALANIGAIEDVLDGPGAGMDQHDMDRCCVMLQYPGHLDSAHARLKKKKDLDAFGRIFIDLIFSKDLDLEMEETAPTLKI